MVKLCAASVDTVLVDSCVKFDVVWICFAVNTIASHLHTINIRIPDVLNYIVTIISPFYCHYASSARCGLCMSVGHTSESCKTAEAFEISFERVRLTSA